MMIAFLLFSHIWIIFVVNLCEYLKTHINLKILVDLFFKQPKLTNDIIKFVSFKYEMNKRKKLKKVRYNNLLKYYGHTYDVNMICDSNVFKNKFNNIVKFIYLIIQINDRINKFLKQKIYLIEEREFVQSHSQFLFDKNYSTQIINSYFYNFCDEYVFFYTCELKDFLLLVDDDIKKSKEF